MRDDWSWYSILSWEQEMVHTPITVIDIAWAAGFLEGEGCFYINLNPKPKSKRIQYARWNITAAQKENEPLLRLQKLFGGVIHLVTRKAHIYQGRMIKETSAYRWALEGSKAVQVAMTLFPLMTTRRQGKIIDILKLWKSRPLRGGLPRNPITGVFESL